MNISIVTPVYNAAQFLAATYACLQRQTLSEWQWVVVDDGSTDGSEQILDNLAAADKRIKLIHQEHSGCAKYPRDRAVYESDGDFILMLDADDLIDDNYLQTMLERMNATDADIVYPHMKLTKEGKTVMTLPVAEIDATKVYDGRDMVRYTIPDWQIGAAGGLYRRHVWVNMSYPKASGSANMNTDELDERLYLLEARRVVFADTCYTYQLHQQSTTKSFSWKRFGILKTNRQLLRIIKKEYGSQSLEYQLMKQKMRNDRIACLHLLVGMVKGIIKR